MENLRELLMRKHRRAPLWYDRTGMPSFPLRRPCQLRPAVQDDPSLRGMKLRVRENPVWILLIPRSHASEQQQTSQHLSCSDAFLLYEMPEITDGLP